MKYKSGEAPCSKADNAISRQ